MLCVSYVQSVITLITKHEGVQLLFLLLFHFQFPVSSCCDTNQLLFNGYQGLFSQEHSDWNMKLYVTLCQG